MVVGCISFVLLFPSLRHTLESLYGSEDDRLVPAMFTPMLMGPTYLVLYALNVVLVPERQVDGFDEPASVVAIEEAIGLGLVVTMSLTHPPSSAAANATPQPATTNRQLAALSINTVMTLVPGSAILLYMYLRRKMFDAAMISSG